MLRQKAKFVLVDKHAVYCPDHSLARTCRVVGRRSDRPYRIDISDLASPVLATYNDCISGQMYMISLGG
jgi:hypothetical protein